MQDAGSILQHDERLAFKVLITSQNVLRRMPLHH